MKTKALGKYDEFEDILKDMVDIHFQLHNESFLKEYGYYTVRQLNMLVKMRNMACMLHTYIETFIENKG